MTPSDQKLIQQAQATRDWQEVDQLMGQAESDRTREQLRQLSRRLYSKEEVFAKCY